MTDIASLTTTPARPPLLKVALGVDAAVTGANGLAYLVLAGPLGDLFGLSETLLRGAGAFLIAFAALVALTAARPRRAAVLAIIVANAVWALDSVVAAVAGWGSPDPAGTVWIVLQAVAVGGFAAAQAVGLRR